MRLRTLMKRAAKVMDRITAGLDDPTVEGARRSSRKIDNAPPTFEATHVERLGARLYSVAHYFQQNGDTMSDPEMEFYRLGDGLWLPVAITQSPVGRHVRAVNFSAATGEPVEYVPRELRDQVGFANMWMINIWQQQELASKPVDAAPVSTLEAANV